MKYLIRNKGKIKSAHYWNGEDTYCKMWSTGGMRKSKGYSVFDDTQGQKICQMCHNIANKQYG